MENDVVDKLNVEKTPEEILKQYYSVIDKIIKLQNQIEPGLDNDFTQLVELQGQEQRLRFELSQYGKYGKDAKKILTYYLKNNKITFLGSDCHHETDFKLKKLKKKLKSLLKSDSMIEDLLENNFNKVISNENFGIRR